MTFPWPSSWKFEHPKLRDQLHHRISSGEPFQLFQESGRRDWQKNFSAGIAILPDPEAIRSNQENLIIITDRTRSDSYPSHAILIHPDSLTLGIASRKGLALEELEEAVDSLMTRHGLSSLSLAALGISQLRERVAAIQDYTEDRSLVLLSYPQTILKRSPEPAHGKIAGTCAASALLAASSRELVVPSTPFFGKLSLAIARRST